METGIKVCDAMTCKPVSVDSETTIIESAKIMAENHVGGIVVNEKNRPIGLITEQDIVRKVIAKGLDTKKTKVKDIILKKLVTVSPDKDVYEAIVLMKENNIRHLPVVFKGKMVGLITGKDILKIQPHLFECLAEVIELREQERKLGMR